ncbi:helix-turn-helix family protein (plasmid) [Anoxybacillus sp. B7M1]|uniref:helix-turn-helix domain-containing protein n=1 Tax=Anoxybacillus sp. B7M1 TaxID=1490057 RepID=UPI000698927C|nr:helix-turn-helix transcriptional regulator [Anoxybacillus sp. B7M1]ANB66179.1 helix-turn-helix family protein [Anoxybacillus sp. B7M1]
MGMDTKKEMGARIRELRRKHNMRTVDVAKKLGIDRSTYSNYENGHREPDVDKIKMLAEIFNTSVDYITGKSAKIDIADVFSGVHTIMFEGSEITETEAVALKSMITSFLNETRKRQQQR